MPHIIVEHTEDIAASMPALISELHENLASQETVEKASIKTRAINIGNAIVGDQDNGSMVHVTLKLLPGRSDDLRAKMTGDFLPIVKNHVGHDVSISVESLELHAASYRK